MSLLTLDPDLSTVVSCPDITITDNTNYDSVNLVTNGDFSSSTSPLPGFNSILLSFPFTVASINPNTTNVYGFNLAVLKDTAKLLFTNATLTLSSDYTVTFEVTRLTTGKSVLVYASDGSNTNVTLGSVNTVGVHTLSVSNISRTGLSFGTDALNGSLEEAYIDNISIVTPASYKRNLSIKNPDGSYVDLGTSNTYTFLPASSTFINNSQVGGVFTFTICGDSVTYTVPVINNASDFACMMQAILELLAATTTGEFANYIESISGNTITLKFSEPGIPVPFLVSYSAGNSTTYYTLSQTVSASQSLDLSDSGDNTLTLTPSDHGGLYTLTLSIWDIDPCDRRIQVVYLWNWCYDYKLLNECFLGLMKDQECGCSDCRHELCNKATQVRNLIEAAQLTELLSGGGPSVQNIIDSALSICDSNCGCQGC